MSTPWRELYRRFDPEAANDDPRWFVDRERSPIRAIRADLEAELDPLGTHALLTGTVGTGKSTELLKLAQQRSSSNFVVFVDLVAHFNRVVQDDAALQRITAWEVCFLAGLQVLRAAEEVLGYVPEGAGYDELASAWEAAARATNTESPTQGKLNLAKLAKSLVVTASAAANPSAGTAAAVGLKLLDSLTDVATAERKLRLPWGRSQVLRVPERAG